MIDSAYENFASGVESALGHNPLGDGPPNTELKGAFRSSYPVFEWCRAIRTPRHSTFFLAEIHSALSVSLSLSAVGLYHSAHIQLRYASECLYSFLYFRDHPRELELVLAGRDLWDQTRPRAVGRFLRQLPEFSSEIAKALIDQLDAAYGHLSGFVHPRNPQRMSLSRHLADLRINTDQAKEFRGAVESVSKAISGMLCLACPREYARAGELKQFMFTRPLHADQRRHLVRAIRG